MLKKLVIYVAAAACVVSVVAGCGSATVSPSHVASVAGATSCDNSGFYIQSKLTGDKAVIYDCRFAEKLPKCVTYSGNIASDATEEVQLLFATSINSQHPACLSWVETAKARLAKIAARKAAAKRLARDRAYQVALTRAAKEPWHQGYTIYADTQDWANYQLPSIYWKWDRTSCADYATNGCWDVEVITRNGCSTGVSVELAEMQGSTQVDTLYGSSGPVGPETPTIIELDALSGDASGMQGEVSSITCN